ncbi:MAG TPA: sugar ABC transporter substrate-binding protein, partial [Spirochaetales bacterium]|nr:sugar ABC transporter substrate-binding protein [Spirochaetales bacterium]
MKIFVRLGMVVSGVLSLIALSVSVSQLLKLGIRQEDDIPVAPIYHFSIYLPDTQDSFFTAIKRGVERAAEEQNVAVSYHSIDPVRLELQQASYTGVDGVAICPYLDDVFAKTQIEKIVQKQIPVILINHLILHDQPWP